MKSRKINREISKIKMKIYIKMRIKILKSYLIKRCNYSKGILIICIYGGLKSHICSNIERILNFVSNTS